MAEITTRISEVPVVAGRFDTNFIETAEKFLNTLPTWSSELNNFGRQANNVKDEMQILHNETLNYKNIAYGYKVDAVNAWNKIQCYTIPTNATYNKDEIDKQLNEITRVQVAQQIILAYLQQPMRDKITGNEYVLGVENEVLEIREV